MKKSRIEEQIDAAKASLSGFLVAHGATSESTLDIVNRYTASYDDSTDSAYFTQNGLRMTKEEILHQSQKRDSSYFPDKTEDCSNQEQYKTDTESLTHRIENNLPVTDKELLTVLRGCTRGDNTVDMKRYCKLRGIRYTPRHA